jgi:hypothetical protein
LDQNSVPIEREMLERLAPDLVTTARGRMHGGSGSYGSRAGCRRSCARTALRSSPSGTLRHPILRGPPSSSCCFPGRFSGSGFPAALARLGFGCIKSVRSLHLSMSHMPAANGGLDVGAWKECGGLCKLHGSWLYLGWASGRMHGLLVSTKSCDTILQKYSMSYKFFELH